MAEENAASAAREGFFYVGLPVLDMSIFVGGLTSSIVGTVAAVDEPSRTWATMNYVFGGLNSAVSIGACTTSVVFAGSQVGGMFTWACIGHTALAGADFVVAVLNTVLAPEAKDSARWTVAPVVAGASGPAAGLTVSVTHF